MNEEDLRRIARELRGPFPGLYVPRRPIPVRQRVGARFVVAPGRADLPGGAPPVIEFLDALLRVPMPNGVIGVAGVNFVVSKVPYRDRMHGELAQHFLTAARLRELQDFLARKSSQPDAIHVFNRVSVLLLQRLILSVSSLGNGSENESGHLLGELALMANDYVTGSELRSEQRQSGSVDYMTLLVEMLPTWDISNPPDLAYGLNRAFQLLQVHLPGDDPQVAKLRQKLPVDFAQATFDGLRIDEYIACVFGMYSVIEALNVYDVINGRQSCVMDMSAFLAKTHIAEASLGQFLSMRSRTVEEFRALLSRDRLDDASTLGAALESDAFIANTIAFRLHPLCRLDGRKVVCLDKHFLSELLIFGLYWRVLEACGAAAGDLFLSLWGRLFELHMYDQLTFHYPTATMSPLRVDVAFPPDGQVDALLDFGDDLILFEFKGSLFKIAAKYNRDVGAFQEEFKLKFFENEKKDPKAKRQLATASAAAVDKALGLPDAPRRIFPVLVGYETSLDGAWVNRYANELFRPLVRSDIASIVQPVTIMSVEAFEQAIAYIAAGDITWPELLSMRFFGENQVVDYSVSQLIYDWRTASGLDVRRNERILAQFEEIYRRVIPTFKADSEKS